mgnify:FL=1
MHTGSHTVEVQKTGYVSATPPQQLQVELSKMKILFCWVPLPWVGPKFVAQGFRNANQLEPFELLPSSIPVPSSPPGLVIPPAPPSGRRPVLAAVWRLTPLGDIPAADADVLTETLRTQLARSGWFRIVAREDMGKILKETQVKLTDACDNTQCAVEYGKLLTAEKMIIGTLGRLGKTYSMTLKVVDVGTGTTEESVEERLKGEPDDLFQLPDRCGARLLEEIRQEEQR